MVKDMNHTSTTNNAGAFLLFVFCSSCLFFLLASGIEDTVDPAGFLPEKTALLVDIKKPATHINKLIKSRIGVQTASIPWREVLSEIGVPEMEIDKMLSVAGEFESLIKSPFFSELFGKQAVLALIPAESSGSDIHLEQMLVLISRPLHNASLVDLAGDLLLNDLDYSVELYKGRIIKTYVYDDNYSFSYSVSDGFIISSFSSAAVKQCIDRSIHNITRGYGGLQGNQNYNRFKERALGKDDQFVYLDVTRLQTIFAKILYSGRTTPLNEYNTATAFNPKPLIRHVAFYREWNSRVITYSCVFQCKMNNICSQSSFFEENVPENDRILSMLPEDHVVHLWANIFDTQKILDFLRLEKDRTIQAFIRDSENWLAGNTSYTLDELISLFGPQVSLNVVEMKSSGIFPMPRISLYVEVKDAEKVQGILKTLFAPIPVQRTSINGHDAYSIILAGGLIQPSYMFYDNYLIIADNWEQLESIFSSRKEKLLKNALFNKVDVGLNEPNNFVLFYRNAELIDGLKELILWYGSLLQLFDKSKDKNRVILKKIVLPIMEGMKMYKVKTVRAYSSEGEIVVKSSQLLEDKGDF